MPSTQAINSAMRKLPNANKAQQDTSSTEKFVDYHGKINSSHGHALSQCVSQYQPQSLQIGYFMVARLALANSNWRQQQW